MTEFHRLDAQDMNEKTTLGVRMVFRLFARPINRLASTVLYRAYERGIITGAQLHTLAAQFDPTQTGVVGRIRGRR